MTKDDGASASRPGSREPSPSVSALAGFDPSREWNEAVEAAASAMEAHCLKIGGLWDREEVAREFSPVIRALRRAEANVAHDADVKFLHDMARYFENRPTRGEDRAHWSNVYNAANCRRIADRLLRDSDTRRMAEPVPVSERSSGSAVPEGQSPHA